jgi:predicted ATPase
MTFLKSLKLSGFLSFPPDAQAVELQPLNVLIGPNASGKSNLIEGIELLHSTPTALAALIREGGTAAEWLWKGEPAAEHAAVEVVMRGSSGVRDLRYRLGFAPSGQRMQVVEEIIEEETKREPGERDVFFYYRFQQGRPIIGSRSLPSVHDIGTGEVYTIRLLEREDLIPDESILSQRKDPEIYPEISWVGRQFARIQTFRDWSFGRSAPLRRPQKTDLPADELLRDSDNLALILNEIQHSSASGEFNRLMCRFLPRYQRFSSRIYGNSVQFYLHEEGLNTPVPATRLSDGTIRFMAILALLLSPAPPPLLCIEEPELGLHPDAVGLFADLLVEASSRMQLIITTHSDALVSALTDNANSVLICDHRGGTILERVEPDKLRHWLDEYRLGEIWRIGQLGGNP